MDPEVRAARRQVLAFVVVVLAAATAFELWMIRSAREESPLAVLGLMWLPFAVSAALRLAGREHPRDVGWRPGPWRALLLAYAIPAACAAFTYGAAALAGGVAYEPPARADAPSWPVAAAIDATLGVLLGSVFALGEEVGWRGYLVPRLVRARVPAPLVVSGVVWGLYHVPLILWGGYATSELPWLSAALFMATIVPAAVFLGWLRLWTGSVWPAVLAHASHNAFYQSVFGGWFGGPLEPWLAGEAGLFSLVAYTGVALWLRRSRRLAVVPASR